jgi:outer membrane protein
MKPLKALISLGACTVLLWANDPLTLSRAYELALQNEPKLKASAFKTEAAKEYINQSKARLYPQVQGNVSWGRYEYEAEYLRAPVKESYTSYALSATQPLYHPELWRGIDEARARESGARYQFQAEAQQLALEVAKAYFNLIRTYRNIELLASQKEYYETKFQQLEEMLKFGLTNRIDLLESKIHRDKAVTEWLTEQRRLQVAQMRLQHLINGPIRELPSFDFSSVNADELFKERSIWEAKLTSNPSLKLAIATRDLSRHQVAIREYEHYPKIDLSLTRKETYTQDTVSHKYDNQAIIQLSIPIYQGGYTQSKVRETLLLSESAQKELEYTQLETTLRFEELWADHELNAQSLVVLRESEKSAELFLDSVEKGHKAGLKSVVDLLEAKAKLFEIKRDTVDAGYALVDNYLGILDVSGELHRDNIILLEKMILKHGEKL